MSVPDEIIAGWALKRNRGTTTWDSMPEETRQWWRDSYFAAHNSIEELAALKKSKVEKDIAKLSQSTVKTRVCDGTHAAEVDGQTVTCRYCRPAAVTPPASTEGGA